MTEHKIITQAESVPDTPPAPREGDTTSGALDMASERDRALVRQATRKRPRWNVPDAKRHDLKAKLDNALDMAESARDYEGVFSGVRTYLGMAAQDQADDHLEDKNERLDSGKATEGVQFIIERVGDQKAADQSPAEATRLPDGQ